jgi:periplasmic protein TonB
MALAQANLDGGGNTDENRAAKTPLPNSRQFKNGDQLEAAEQRVRELEARQRALLTQTRNQARQLAQQKPHDVQPVQPPEVTGIDLAANALAMARLEAQIDRNVEDYNKRPKKKFIGARTVEYRFAQYIEDWRQKVERIGTINYPEAARGKIYGELVLTVVLQADGSVDRVEINRSSGHSVLDDAARRIVQMGGPYAAFPPDIRRDTDQLEIVRTWSFTRDDTVRTN